jgi:hypothetical protein
MLAFFVEKIDFLFFSYFNLSARKIALKLDDIDLEGQFLPA